MRLLLVLLLSMTCLSLQAQIDSEEKSVAIPVIEAEEGEPEEVDEQENAPIQNNGLVIPKEDKVNGLSVPKQNQPLDLPQGEFSMTDTEEFGDPGELYIKQIKKHASYTELKDEKSQRGSTTTQFLGDFTTSGGAINIVYRDYGAFDGDHIRIFVNDVLKKSRVLLRPDYTGFKLELLDGINKIDFFALDTGQISPNTAEFQVLDEEGNVITANQWNLASGVKATIIVIKE